MGVKSTVELTREQAEERWIDLMLELARPEYKGRPIALDSTTLEDLLEVLNDAAHNGEGFENYRIVD